MAVALCDEEDTCALYQQLIRSKDMPSSLAHAAALRPVQAGKAGGEMINATAKEPAPQQPWQQLLQQQGLGRGSSGMSPGRQQQLGPGRSSSSTQRQPSPNPITHQQQGLSGGGEDVGGRHPSAGRAVRAQLESRLANLEELWVESGQVRGGAGQGSAEREQCGACVRVAQMWV